MSRSEKKVALVIFEGGNPQSEIEHYLVMTRQAIVCDNIEKFRAVPEIGPIIVVTNYPELKREAEQLGAIVDFNIGEFHFGTRFKEVIHKYRLERVFYMGGASAPLLTAEELSAFARQLLEQSNIVLTNNVQSSDLLAFAPASAIDRVRYLPDADNPLGNLLRDAGLHKLLMPHSVGIHFDIDTPTDLLVLSLHPNAGPRTKKLLERLPYSREHIIAAKHWLALPYDDVLMFGRIGSPIITYVNTNVRCRLRVYSEERGMKALGRVESNQVKSLIGHLVDIVGPQAFFDYLADLADVAFIDSRVLFAHNKLHPSDNDRFYSDLFMPERIVDPAVRQLTEAAMAARLTVVLGGHSLVLGGVWALVDAIMYEEQLAYSPHKLYEIKIGDNSILANKPFSAIRKLIPSGITIYGVTRPKTAEQTAFTYAGPDGSLLVKNGYFLHAAGPIEAIKALQAMCE